VYKWSNDYAIINLVYNINITNLYKKKKDMFKTLNMLHTTVGQISTHVCYLIRVKIIAVSPAGSDRESKPYKGPLKV
jgi:hypothetical protein